MTYDISLWLVALVVGCLYVAAHLPGVVAPGPFIRILRAVPRNYPLGVVLTAAAGLWLALLTAKTDLGELSTMRTTLIAVWSAGTALTILFMPVFLAVRGIAFLMLLSVAVMLDSAFLVDSDSRLVVTVLAYVWAVVGIMLVASPYLMRDVLDWVFRTEARCRMACGAGAMFGGLLVVLSLAVYRAL
jgi:hypothetical protein